MLRYEDLLEGVLFGMELVKVTATNEFELDMSRRTARRRNRWTRRIVCSALALLGGVEHYDTPRRSIDRQLQQDWPASE
ncbi:MAG: hypothetical protein ACREQE_09280 [Candidatus Binataceae bacterium]